ncbi:helix-hairpin-helix domain-containing protein [uncultured Deinococcus sp.]|uniref:helix-hairpin-helix domain-containing protein n=1 Tax=uncultured Deinococcus sp. TaxID=158789 RepID=UPI003747DC7E
MKTPIPAALARVRVSEDPTLDAAAQITVDYTGGGDIAHLVLNPEHAPPEALEGYRTRAAITAALEPLRRYNRAVTRRYGTYEDEQRLFDEGLAKAAAELEQLVHLTPTSTSVPTLDVTPPTPEPLDEALPDDFPEAEALRGGGYRTRQAVRDAADDALLALPGIGPKRLEAIRAALS